jgi:N-acylglucosamine-6-phosphate 2-epimerase
MNLESFRQLIQGRLIVSCQADHGPLRQTPTLVCIAQAAVAGGAAAIRCGGVGGVADVSAIAAAVAVPVIGLTKSGDPDVYITPTVAAAIAVVDAGAAVIACDATGRPRRDGSVLADTVEVVHQSGRLVMADVSTVAEGLAALDAGADMVATTLSGYTLERPARPGPDLDLVADLRSAAPSAVLVAEGRIHAPHLAVDALAAGATAVVVGTAITDPAWITGRFAASMDSRDAPVGY